MLEDFWALPIHPPFVHFPVAMLTTTWAITLFGHLTGSRRGARFAGGAELIGVAFLPLAILTGIRDAGWGDLLDSIRWDQPQIWHAIGSLAAAGLFAGHAAWRYRVGDRRVDRPWFDVGLTTVGFWLLLTTGLIAGEMVYG